MIWRSAVVNVVSEQLSVSARNLLFRPRRVVIPNPVARGWRTVVRNLLCHARAGQAPALTKASDKRAIAVPR